MKLSLKTLIQLDLNFLECKSLNFYPNLNKLVWKTKKVFYFERIWLNTWFTLAGIQINLISRLASSSLMENPWAYFRQHPKKIIFVKTYTIYESRNMQLQKKHCNFLKLEYNDITCLLNVGRSNYMNLIELFNWIVEYNLIELLVIWI